MAVRATAVGWPRAERVPAVGLLAAVAIGVLAVAHGVVASRWPLVDIGLAGLAAFVCFPRLCRGVLVAVVLVGPLFNPPLLGIGTGRVYLLQALIVGVVAGGVVLATRNGMHRSAFALVALAGLLVAVETIGRPNAGIAWVYRPLQVFFVAYAVRSLYLDRGDALLVQAVAWGSVLGCALASVHALFPAFDPFAVSRPADLPFVSAIGDYARATGAFTYPNNLGTFAAYSVLLGASAWLLGRPHLSRGLAVAVMAAGSAALALAGSRAAGLGLLVGLLYLTAKAGPKRRGVLLAAEAVFGLAVVTFALTSPTGREVVEQRVSSATGESFFGRVEAVRETVDEFRRSPLVGTGSSESRIDNFVILHVTQAGIVGAVLLVGIGLVALRTRQPKRYPELWAGLLLAMGVSGMLQDSLGQTLVTWFPGALLGISMLRPDGAARLRSELR